MMHSRFKQFKLIAFLAICGILLTSCKPVDLVVLPLAPDNEAAENPTQNNPDSSSDTTTNQPEGEESTSPGISPTPNRPTPTPIVERRLPPERWREWPVIPELTGREFAIYQLGQELGNDPTNFSKVGDCQAIKDVLMGIYDTTDRYILSDSEAYLQETIDHFAGSFGRDGQAVRGGYNAAAVISPIWSDPEVCNPGETPIECENRIHKPSFVIISLEVWWEGRTVERYEEYMRRIIDFYIENGVVPILSTKADNVEGDHRINLATAKLAYDYHIPLWNFWLAVQSLPNQGIDPNRDGFHISYDAWTVRSYTALRALDAVWRGVRDQELTPDAVIETPKPEATDAVSEILISPRASTPDLPLEGKRIIFSLSQRIDDEVLPQGIYAYTFENKSLYQVLGSGFNLEDVNGDGTTLLVSDNQNLLVVNQQGEVLNPITDKLAISNRDSSAFWMPSSEQVVLITDEGQTNALWRVDLSDNTWQNIAEGDITGIIEPFSDDLLYWYEGECHPDLPCENVSLKRWQTGTIDTIIEKDQVAFSHTSNDIAWVEATPENSLILYTRTLDVSNQNYLYLPGNRMVDLAWSPAAEQLALLSVTRSDYSGKSSDARIFIVNSPTLEQREYWAIKGLNPRLYWHQDGSSLLLTSTLALEDAYQVNINQLDLNTNLFTSYNEDLEITSNDFITINNLFWIIP